MPSHLPDDAGAVRRALNDPWRLCEALGLTEGAERQRAGLSIRCPWHPDQGPSCSVTRGPDGTVRVHCFGCGHTGDALSLIAAVRGLKLEGDDFGAVLREGANIAGIRLGQARPQIGRGPAVRAPLEDGVFAELAALLLRLGALDNGELTRDVVAYLRGRRLLHLAQAEGWGALPPASVQRAWLTGVLLDAFGADVLARSGLVRGSAFAEPGARLLIPWRDAAGSVCTLQRRRIDKAMPKYVIPAGRPPRCPYGVHWLAGAAPDAPVAFVEGAVDAIALRELCARHNRQIVPLGIPGVAGWTGAWAELARGRLAYVALDADSAGERAVENLSADLLVAGATAVKRWTPRGAKDWADVLHAESGSESGT
jgi:DNA primase